MIQLIHWLFAKNLGWVNYFLLPELELQLYKFHKINKRSATVTAVNPTPRFGKLDVVNNQIINFKEKKRKYTNELINGGFFILNKRIFKLINNFENRMWEDEPIQELIDKNELSGYHHDDFWYPVDTLRDKNYLEKLWDENRAPWKIWE